MAFCTNCGTQLPDGSQFCSNCGTKKGEAASTAASVDTNKVLKDGDFRRLEKLSVKDAMSKKNDGKLTLFCDRIEWRGEVNEDLKIDDIVKVVVTDRRPDVFLDITDSAGKTRMFFQPRKVGRDMLEAVATHSWTKSAATTNTEIENWRAAIEKLRGRL